MAVVWGAEHNHLQVGINVVASPATVSHNTANVTLTIYYYARSVRWGFNDNQRMHFSGAVAGYHDFQMYSPNNTTRSVLVTTRTINVTPQFAGPVSRSFVASITGAYNGATPSSSTTFRVSAKPILAPEKGSFSRLTRVTDTLNNAYWANRGTVGAPWDRIQFGVGRWNGTSFGYTYYDLAGDRTSFGVPTQPNNRYRFAIKAFNSQGASDWAYSGYISTTPAAPSSLTAVKSGEDIRLRWTVNANYGSHIIIHRSVNGAAFTARAMLSLPVTTFLDDAVTPGNSYRYRVQHYESDGALRSVWSNTTGEVNTSGISIGSSKGNNFYWGTRPVQRIYLGSKQAWQRG